MNKSSGAYHTRCAPNHSAYDAEARRILRATPTEDYRFSALDFLGSNA
ncbi:MAG TPA: hypothetical protein VFF95_02915 [Candidatus Binatus sp.]|nr:hypothetical protein [Candidatus Binatus sp.]